MGMGSGSEGGKKDGRIGWREEEVGGGREGMTDASGVGSGSGGVEGRFGGDILSVMKWEWSVVNEDVMNAGPFRKCGRKVRRVRRGRG